MEVKLKLKDALNLNQALREIIDNSTVKADAVFKFKLLGIMKALETPVSHFDVIRNEKIVEYGEEADDGSIHIPQDDPEIMAQFTHDMEKILDTEITVSLDKLKPSQVFDSGVPADLLVKLYILMEE